MTKTLTFPERPDATPAESAKALKQALKARFPATAFSVRLDRGTAYGCASVSWTDGPSRKMVEQVIAPFEGEGFDGMTDSTIHYRAYLPDGRRSRLRLVNAERRISPALAKRAAAQVAAYYGVPEPVLTVNEYGSWQIEGDTRWVREDIGEYWSSLIWRAAEDHSRYARNAA